MLQLMAQLVPLHVAVPCPLGGVEHGVHMAPQLEVSEFDTHVPLQSC